MTARWIRRALLGVLGFGASTRAAAHEIHTTHTVVTADASGYTLMIRAFADDLSASVARFRGKSPPADSSVVAADLLAYAQSRLTVTDAAGGRLASQLCGLRREQETYMLCLRIPATVATGGLTVDHRMLAELHSDQVNIVQCEVAGTRRTNLFMRGRAATAIVTRGRCAAS